jgi:hypothetical protein
MAWRYPAAKQGCAGGQRCVSGPRRVGGAGRRRCGRRRREIWLGCAQNGGVVWMGDGVVTFKGGTITNTTTAVSTGHDGGWHVCPRCSMLANGMWRSVRRTLHGGAAVDDSFELVGVCCVLHGPFGMRPALSGTMHVVAHSLSLSVASHVLCHVADGTLPGASFWRMERCLVHRFVAVAWPSPGPKSVLDCCSDSQ